MQMRSPFPIPFGWFQVAWSADVKPGQVLPIEYFDRKLVVWRDDDGATHVNDAFCPHLGAHFGYGGQVQATTSSARSTAGASTPRATTRSSPTPIASTRRRAWRASRSPKPTV